MGSITKLSEQMVDLAERFENVTHAAQGGSRNRGLRARWLVLPVAGAGLYALATSGAFARQAKSVVTQAKDRASDLPEELLNRVQQSNSGAKNGRRSSRTSARRKTSSSRR